MKLVKIGNSWISPTEVIGVEPFSGGSVVFIKEHKTSIMSQRFAIEVAAPIDEVVAIINGGLE